MTPPNVFGSSSWSNQKLRLLWDYLKFYTTALRGKGFRLRYVDAFAGSGTFGPEDAEELDGSALGAMQVDPPFDLCSFIEMDSAKLAELKERLSCFDTPHAEFFNNDCNIIIKQICNLWGSNDRGVIFLDPFAMQVEWPTLQAIARTERIDLWFLVPVSAMSRTLPREGGIPPEWLPKLIRTFGQDPTPHLYSTVTQPALLGDDAEDIIRQGSNLSLYKYMYSRLKSIFRGFVHPEVLILYNSHNSPLFLLMFCLANPHPKAVSLARRVVKDIMRSHRKAGGYVIGLDD